MKRYLLFLGALLMIAPAISQAAVKCKTMTGYTFCSGLSTDSKPSLEQNDEFWETDTKDLYKRANGAWSLYVNGSAGANPGVSLYTPNGDSAMDDTADAVKVIGGVAHGSPDSGNPIKVGGKYNATPPTLTDGSRSDLQVDSAGSLKVNPGALSSTTDSVTAVGNIAHNSADSGNPVKIGGRYDASLSVTSVADEDRVDYQASQEGGIMVAAKPVAGGVADGSANTVALLSHDTTTKYPLSTANYNYNGSTWDKGFTCASSAVVNVASGSTQEVVALSPSKIIRVCSIVLTADTIATTATISYGTGTTCGSGNVALTGAMRLQDEGNISITAANGSLMRTAASNALCVTAATGAVTGFITYTQY